MKHIGVIPGDGIGPEVTAEVEALLDLFRAGGLPIAWDVLPYSANYYLTHGRALPEDGLASLAPYDALFVGAFGDPRVPDMAHAREILLGARRGFDLYVNERPVRLLHDGLTPLKGRGRADVDFVIFRENTEGAYVGLGGRFRRGTPDELAVQEAIATRRGVERILRHAFGRASASPRKTLHMADKHNALEHVGGLWLEVFHAVASEFPGVGAQQIFVDTFCHDVVRDPGRFDVVVTSNLFGDLISDLGAALAGGLGIAASANVNPETGKGLFEPVHGSAFDLAGKGTANPVAALLSAGMMLAFLGFGDAARGVERAVEDAVAAGETTRDLGGTLGTSGAGEAVRKRLKGGVPWA